MELTDTQKFTHPREQPSDYSEHIPSLNLPHRDKVKVKEVALENVRRFVDWTYQRGQRGTI